jgi:hypothetical protein
MTVKILRVEDGVVATYETETPWYEGDRGPDTFSWAENNYACDCNRHIFFESAIGEQSDDEDDFPCGDTAYRIRIEFEGKVIYSEFEAPA